MAFKSSSLKNITLVFVFIPGLFFLCAQTGLTQPDTSQQKTNSQVRSWLTVGELQAKFLAKKISCCPPMLNKSETIIISISQPGVLKQTVKYDKYPNWPEVDVSMPNSGVHWHVVDSNGNYNLNHWASSLSDIFVQRELARYLEPEKPVLGKPATELYYYEVRPGRGVFEIAPLCAWGREYQLGWLVDATFQFSPGLPKEGEEFHKDFSVSKVITNTTTINESWENLGASWIVIEIEGWTGIWTRRPGTGVFDAVWKNVNGSIAKDVIVVESFNGKKVTLSRQGNKGKYYGTLSDSGLTITGSTSWYPTGSQWTATIQNGTVIDENDPNDSANISNIAGRWIIYSGGVIGGEGERNRNYRAVFEIYKTGSGLEGRIKFDVFNDWEKLEVFRYKDGTITFTRPPYLSRTFPQFYLFKADGEKLEGMFWQTDDSRRWRTWGEKEK